MGVPWVTNPKDATSAGVCVCVCVCVCLFVYVCMCVCVCVCVQGDGRSTHLLVCEPQHSQSKGLVAHLPTCPVSPLFHTHVCLHVCAEALMQERVLLCWISSCKSLVCALVCIYVCMNVHVVCVCVRMHTKHGNAGTPKLPR
jgi:hypothetical protein